MIYNIKAWAFLQFPRSGKSTNIIACKLLSYSSSLISQLQIHEVAPICRYIQGDKAALKHGISLSLKNFNLVNLITF